MWHVQTYNACCNPEKRYKVFLGGNEDIEALSKQFQTSITGILMENPQIGRENWNGLEAGRSITVTGRYCGEVPNGGAKRFWEVIE